MSYTSRSLPQVLTTKMKKRSSKTGTMWHFLKLEGQQLYIDKKVYSIGQCDKILGILASMVEQKA